MTDSIFDQAMARAHEGMEIAAVAAAVPDRIAIYSERGQQSFGELNHQANQVARLLHHPLSVRMRCTTRYPHLACT